MNGSRTPRSLDHVWKVPCRSSSASRMVKADTACPHVRYECKYVTFKEFWIASLKIRPMSAPGSKGLPLETPQHKRRSPWCFQDGRIRYLAIDDNCDWPARYLSLLHHVMLIPGNRWSPHLYSVFISRKIAGPAKKRLNGKGGNPLDGCGPRRATSWFHCHYTALLEMHDPAITEVDKQQMQYSRHYNGLITGRRSTTGTCRSVPFRV